MIDADTTPLTATSTVSLTEDLDTRPGLLVIVAGENKERVFTLDHAEMVCGRDSSCIVSVDDEHLSRNHFSVSFIDNSYIIEDNHSTNGTFLNDRKIDGHMALVGGDIVSAGNTKFKFISGSSPDRFKYDSDLQDSITDKLTGCFTKSYFSAEITQAMDHSFASDKPLCLLSFSIDSFEQVTKDSGADIANFFLNTSINRIRHHGIRADDHLGRFYENEFILLLAGAPLNRTREISVRLLDLFDGKPIRYMHDHLKTTLSIGIAEMTSQTSESESLIENVLSALRESRNSGGNCISVFE